MTEEADRSASGHQGKDDDGKDKIFRVYINGVTKELDHELLTYDEVVRLAFPNPVEGNIYSVTFEKSRDPKEGELVAGQTVSIKQNTEFDVDDTGRS